MRAAFFPRCGRVSASRCNRIAILSPQTQTSVYPRSLLLLRQPRAMQSSRGQRAPGSFSPLPGAPSAAAPAPRPPPPRRVESSESEESTTAPPITVSKSRGRDGSPATPIYQQFASQANSSSASLHQNFSRPNATRAPMTMAQQGSSSALLKGHSRKHSATQGLFDSTMPSTSTSNLAQVSLSQHPSQPMPSPGLSASQIAAQAAVFSHQHNQHNQQSQQNQQQHARQRSQTVPFPGDANDATRRGSGSKTIANPPTLSLTEASAPRESGFGNVGAGQHQDRTGGSHSHSLAATAAANVVFPRSGHNSPREPSTSPQPFPQLPPPPLPPTVPEKQSKSEKAKAKLFSRPSKISTKGETKDKPLPSPGKIGHALSALQRGNFSTSSLVDSSSQSLYNLNNSSSATIRPSETPTEERGKEKEKRHHFLSRQKHKLKDEYHLPLSSAASNSRPTDPNAPSSLYNFNVPSSPGPSSTTFSKVKKDKKRTERSDSRLDGESYFGSQASDWSGPTSLPAISPQAAMYDPVDPGRLGLHNHMSLDDAWPYLKAKLLVIFEGEDLRLPVEDFNRVVQMHIQFCIHKRSPNAMLEDLRDLLATGFSSLDRTLQKTAEDHFIPALVELWLFTFTSILPYIQSVFLPLDLEVSGRGTIMTLEQARDFWGGVIAQSSANDKTATTVAPVSTVLDVRRLVLTSFRDKVVLPRYDTLKTIFSRLSLEFLPSSLANMALASPTPDSGLSTSPPESFSSMARPGTAMSLDPSVGSYNSNSTTLLGDGSAGGRSRAISNVSFGSHGSDGIRPFTPSGLPPTLGSVREQNVEGSKQVTDMVGRMLQCMSVLSSLGGFGDSDDDGNKRMVELCKMLKLNWLGRGRTGRNRRGIVGGRVRRDEAREEVRVA